MTFSVGIFKDILLKIVARNYVTWLLCQVALCGDISCRTLKSLEIRIPRNTSRRNGFYLFELFLVMWANCQKWQSSY